MWCKRKEERENESGFTLIELLLVVTILGILAAVVVMRITDVGTDARIQATRVSIASIGSAVDVFEVRTSRLPETMDDLTTDSAGRPALLRKTNLNDGWGHPILYKKVDRVKYEVRSSGVDEQMGTEDDLTN